MRRELLCVCGHRIKCYRICEEINLFRERKDPQKIKRCLAAFSTEGQKPKIKQRSTPQRNIVTSTNEWRLKRRDRQVQRTT